MARQRSPKRDKAFEIYKKHNGDILLKDIAKQLKISDVQIRKWKSNDKWEQKLKGTLKSNVTNKDKSINQEPMHEEVKEILSNSQLTDKQRLFCFYYSRCLNATKAYQKAYKCSYIEAARNSYILRKNKDVNKLIDLYMDYEIDKERLKKSLVQKYIDIAFSNIKEYLTFGQKEVPVMGPFGPIKDKETGKVITKIVNTVDFKESNEVDGTLINEVKQGRDGVSIKLADKMKAMDWLSNHIDLLTTEQKHKLEIEQAKIKQQDTGQEDNILKDMLEGLKDE